MPIVTFANSKGGVGKSTLCCLIASELALQDTRVLVLDADGQKSCFKWAERCRAAGTLPSTLKVECTPSLQELQHRLMNRDDADVVLIDVQGSMNDLLTAAIVVSAITIVPTKATVMEMVEAVQLFEWSRNLKRAPLRLVLNSVEGIDVKTAAFQDAVALIRTNGLPCLPNFVRSRKVYQQFSRDAGSLPALATDPDKVVQVEKARKNIHALIADIFADIGIEAIDQPMSA
jgi:chromosome partitioning protein